MIKRLACLILGFVLLMSTAGVFVSKHFCQNELKSTALYSQARPCHSGMNGTSCAMHANMDTPMKKGCCDDQSTFVKSDTDQITVEQTMQPDLVEFTAVAALVRDIFAVDTDTRVDIKFLNHKPPLILRDRAAMLQTFRF